MAAGKKSYEEILAQFTEKQIKLYRDVFDSFDADKSESIDLEELAEVFRALGQTPSTEEIQDIIKEVDIDGSGQIDFDEFLQVIARQEAEADNDEEMLEAFKAFDKDNDGFITAKELCKAMRSLGESLSEYDCEDIVSSVVASDRRISYKDFVTMMNED